jgi:hypothetical protein
VSAHTPGPWRIVEEPPCTWSNGEVDHGGFRIDADGIEQLAYIWRNSRRWGTDHEPFGAPQAEGNARLIAAAPELLEALLGMIGLVELIIPTLKGEQKGTMSTNHRVLAAGIAIAKARGAG